MMVTTAHIATAGTMNSKFFYTQDTATIMG